MPSSTVASCAVASRGCGAAGATRAASSRSAAKAEDSAPRAWADACAPPRRPSWITSCPRSLCVSGSSPSRSRGAADSPPLCASLDGFTLHAATRAGSHHLAGRDALLRYAPRPPIAKDRLEIRPDGLVRITLKRAYDDGTVAVDLDPLSLLCRLATSVPPPRFHTVKCSQAAGRRMERRPPDANGVLAPASPWRARIAPEPPEPAKPEPQCEPKHGRGASNYRPWAELLTRSFGVDVLECPRCQGRMRLIAMVTERSSLRRFLTGVGERGDVPERSPSRGPPYWKSVAMRRKATGDAA